AARWPRGERRPSPVRVASRTGDRSPLPLRLADADEPDGVVAVLGRDRGERHRVAIGDEVLRERGAQSAQKVLVDPGSRHRSPRGTVSTATLRRARDLETAAPRAIRGPERNGASLCVRSLSAPADLPSETFTRVRWSPWTSPTPSSVVKVHACGKSIAPLIPLSDGFPSSPDDPRMRSGPRAAHSPKCATRGPGLIMTLFPQFVPHLGDRSCFAAVCWCLTHPPVVFGPHRSPRDGGQLFRRASCNI